MYYVMKTVFFLLRKIFNVTFVKPKLPTDIFWLIWREYLHNITFIFNLKDKNTSLILQTDCSWQFLNLLWQIPIYVSNNVIFVEHKPENIRQNQSLNFWNNKWRFCTTTVVPTVTISNVILWNLSTIIKLENLQSFLEISEVKSYDL